MAQLAIKGHKKRGEEVIEILEMLGGRNTNGYNGYTEPLYYYIDKDGSIEGDADKEILFPCIYSTLEEFLEKFPYKVGDKVLYKIYNVYSTIKTMTWNEEKEQVIYRLDSQKLWVATADELEKSTIKTITIEDFKANSKEWLIDTLESMSKDDALQTICDLHDELHKPQLPTTYEDCCKVLNIIPNNKLVFSNPNEESEYAYRNLALYNDLDKLKVCRDAYWKIAGEETGFGKSWEPDYDSGVNKYGIICIYGVTQKSTPTTNWERHLNKVLDFPTAEMRDAFYENFKELIESCKELL